jgi:glycosyltransferase involved in cell wall biosynthesis
MLQACVDKRVMSAQELVCQLPNTVTPSPGTIVAIPARDEEERIGACLEALLAQRDRCGRLLPPDALGVVLLLNNCSDRTAAIAKSRLVCGRTPFALVDVALPLSQANAGFARRLALDLAAAWLAPADHPRGVLLTTDADSRVPPQWLVQRRSAAAPAPWREE